MKNLLFASAILLFSLSSCSDELDCCVLEGNPQKWELVEMTGSFSPSITTGNEMDWQEYYILNTNTGKFTKSRTREGVETSASGTFVFNSTEEEHSIKLTYPSDNELIANCTGDLTEVLIIESENTLKGTWAPCDGPGLKYQRTNN